MLKRLPKFMRSFYFIAGVLFLIWMIFIDSNDLYTRYKLSKKRKELEMEKEYYLRKIEEVKKDREELMSNEELLEKFAREKYLMKKNTEDLYLIVEE